MAQNTGGTYLPSAFGLLIAFVAPGVVAIWGVAQISPTVAAWFGASAAHEASGAGFLFVLLASLASGVFISGLRAALIPRIFALIGTKRADDLDESRTKDPECRAALRQAVDDFFIYHQFYGNMVFAVLLAYGAWLYAEGGHPGKRPLILILVLVAIAILLVSAHYSLNRYFEVEKQALGKGGSGGS